MTFCQWQCLYQYKLQPLWGPGNLVNMRMKLLGHLEIPLINKALFKSGKGQDYIFGVQWVGSLGRSWQQRVHFSCDSAQGLPRCRRRVLINQPPVHSGSMQCTGLHRSALLIQTKFWFRVFCHPASCIVTTKSWYKAIATYMYNVHWTHWTKYKTQH